MHHLRKSNHLGEKTNIHSKRYELYLSFFNVKSVLSAYDHNERRLLRLIAQ